MQNMELLRAIENCLACQVWHACRRLPTPGLDHTSKNNDHCYDSRTNYDEWGW